MRTPLLATLPLMLLLALAPAARADDSVAGTFDVKVEEMADNCSPPPVALQTKSLTIEVKAGNVAVHIDTIPLLQGPASKVGGKVAAKTSKRMATTVTGLDGDYRIAGHVAPDRALELVLIAEYTRQDTKKAYCTQSWTITGKPAASK